MSRSVTESDWKVFRELRAKALERLCEKILDEARREVGREGKSAHERYLALYELLQRRDQDIARGFNDLRRSTALGMICVIHAMGLFTADELRRFSPGTQEIIRLSGPIPDA